MFVMTMTCPMRLGCSCRDFSTSMGTSFHKARLSRSFPERTSTSSTTSCGAPFIVGDYVKACTSISAKDRAESQSVGSPRFWRYMKTLLKHLLRRTRPSCLDCLRIIPRTTALIQAGSNEVKKRFVPCTRRALPNTTVRFSFPSTSYQNNLPRVHRFACTRPSRSRGQSTSHTRPSTRFSGTAPLKRLSSESYESSPMT